MSDVGLLELPKKTPMLRPVPFLSAILLYYATAVAVSVYPYVCMHMAARFPNRDNYRKWAYIFIKILFRTYKQAYLHKPYINRLQIINQSSIVFIIRGESARRKEAEYNNSRLKPSIPPKITRVWGRGNWKRNWEGHLVQNRSIIFETPPSVATVGVERGPATRKHTYYIHAQVSHQLTTNASEK